MVINFDDVQFFKSKTLNNNLLKYLKKKILIDKDRVFIKNFNIYNNTVTSNSYFFEIKNTILEKIFYNGHTRAVKYILDNLNFDYSTYYDLCEFFALNKNEYIINNYVSKIIDNIIINKNYFKFMKNNKYYIDTKSRYSYYITTYKYYMDNYPYEKKNKKFNFNTEFLNILSDVSYESIKLELKYKYVSPLIIRLLEEKIEKHLSNNPDIIRNENENEYNIYNILDCLTIITNNFEFLKKYSNNISINLLLKNKNKKNAIKLLNEILKNEKIKSDKIKNYFNNYSNNYSNNYEDYDTITIDELINNFYKIRWDKLCSNENSEIVEFIKQYPDYIDWHTFCKNENSIAVEFIKQYSNYINWSSFCKNENSIAIEFIKQHPDKIILSSLALNKNPKAIEIIDNYLYNHPPITIRALKRNECYNDYNNECKTNIDFWINLSENPNSTNLMIKYFDKYKNVEKVLNHLFRFNSNINEILKYYPDNINYDKFKLILHLCTFKTPILRQVIF